MPQLPSGRHVGITTSPIEELARKGDLNLKLLFPANVMTPADMAALVTVAYYHLESDPSTPGEPYRSGLFLADVGTDKCDWSEEDITAFNAWLETPRQKAFMQESFDKLKHILETVKVVMPEKLKGVMEADEFETLKYCFTEDADLPEDSQSDKNIPLTPQQQSVLNKSRENDRLGHKPKRRHLDK